MASPSTCGFSLLLRQRQTATGKLQRLRTCFLFFEDSKGVFLGKGDVRPQRHGDTDYFSVSRCLSGKAKAKAKDRLLCRHSISDTIQRLFSRRSGLGHRVALPESGMKKGAKPSHEKAG